MYNYMKVYTVHTVIVKYVHMDMCACTQLQSLAKYITCLTHTNSKGVLLASEIIMAVGLTN